MFTRTHKVPQLTETAYKLVNTLKKTQTNIFTRANISKLFCLSNTFAFLHLIGKGFQSHLQIKGLELENYRVFKIFMEERCWNEKWISRKSNSRIIKITCTLFLRIQSIAYLWSKALNFLPSFHALSRYLNLFANASNHACSSISPICRSHFQQQVSQFYYYYRYPTG